MFSSCGTNCKPPLTWTTAANDCRAGNPQSPRRAFSKVCSMIQVGCSLRAPHIEGPWHEHRKESPPKHATSDTRAHHHCNRCTTFGHEGCVHRWERCQKDSATSRSKRTAISTQGSVVLKKRDTFLLRMPLLHNQRMQFYGHGLFANQTLEGSDTIPHGMNNDEV